ncbi:hypothetical protein [Streptomyces sp. NBC_00102]|uniref:hypothetical protein n=1 Tax=Streptomyces sp. NBC_00102 TaxID=2975652 RepID=UPI0022554070|nr:hypothetical protein [Streptomyces sp. NBC_00102]MCX5397130.1 hypothetical protein [Streptomyces sp. NBC_00102]
MKDLVRRVAGSLKRPVSPPPAAVRYPRPHPSGPTVRSIGGRPLRGEDTALVRPYLVAHELRADRIAAAARPAHTTGVAA